MEPELVQRLRGLCLALPQATERPSHGEPTWFVRDRKVFVTLSSGGHHGPEGFWCAAPPGEQEAWLATDPDRVFRPPYVGGRGWLGVRLDADTDWTRVGEFVRDAYRCVAPAELAAQV